MPGRRSNCSLIIALLIFGTAAGGGVFAPEARANVSASSEFECKMKEGLEEYAHARYNAAQTLFEDAIMSKPMDARAHFYLAKTRLKLRDAEGARQEFKNAFKVDPFGPYGERSKSHLLDCATEVGQQQAAPIDPKAIVQKTIEQISRQSRTGIGANMDRALKQEETRQRGPGMEDIVQQPRELPMPKFRKNSRNNIPVVRDPGDMTRRRALRQGQQLLSLRERAESGRRALALQESANSLSRLLAERPVDGKPKLRAFGTNLYVRYYGKEDPYDQPAPVDPLLELRAQPKLAPATQWLTRKR